MTDWQKVAPPRFDKAAKALKLAAQTTGRHYENVDTARALDHLREVEQAWLLLRAAYRAAGAPIEAGRPEPAEPEPPRPPTTDRADPMHPHRVALNVADIPVAQLTSYLTQIAARICAIADGRAGP